MRILSLDLGVTTGWASVYRFGDAPAIYVSSGTIPYALHRAQLKLLLSTWDVNHVAIEMPLLTHRGQLRNQLENVVAWTMSEIGNTPRTQFYAADWKQTPYAKLKVRRGASSHERDAIRMGMWFAETRLQGC